MKRSTPSSESKMVDAVRRIEEHTDVPTLSTLVRPVSPPTISKSANSVGPSLSAVEAGKDTVEDHFSFFSSKLLEASRPSVPAATRISYRAWCELYQRNMNPHGRHFVIHQHDHPVAGTHYDLRLQCNATSSISFAIMYGLPGDPNSRRISRNAIETRVHPVWNHLIEAASHSTGSLLIWDTGEYSILPYRQSKGPQGSSGEGSDGPGWSDEGPVLSESQKLHKAFKQGKIRLRLHGARLPPGYTISLRLDQDNYHIDQPGPPKRRRIRSERQRIHTKTLQTSSSEVENNTSSSSSAHSPVLSKRHLRSVCRTASPPVKSGQKSAPAPSPGADGETGEKPSFRTSNSQERLHTHPKAAYSPKYTTTDHPVSESESETIRRKNAYPGATNDISSIHQRRWYLTLDRANSGFAPQSDKVTGRKLWVRQWRDDGERSGFEKFYVLGRDSETSVLTGRLATEVLKDEGVEGFRPRRSWRAVTE